MSNFIISLDFELLWGVLDTQTIAQYGNNVEGVWVAIPKLLALFNRYNIRATWATVGMVMCRDYKHWSSIRPTLLPGYRRQKLSPYTQGAIVKDQPRLFFARPLVDAILSTPGQEVASHSYSHFCCMEPGATPEQFSADLHCARVIATEMGITYRSFVFPRNQIHDAFLSVLKSSNFKVYRGNHNHWLYRDGHATPYGSVGRIIRFGDSWLPLTGNLVSHPSLEKGLVKTSASIFLRSWPSRLSALEPIRMSRIKQLMTAAAKKGADCHIWWHPHNFGVNIDQNLIVLEAVLQHFIALKDKYGMRSISMGDLATELKDDQG